MLLVERMYKFLTSDVFSRKNQYKCLNVHTSEIMVVSTGNTRTRTRRSSLELALLLLSALQIDAFTQSSFQTRPTLYTGWKTHPRISRIFPHHKSILTTSLTSDDTAMADQYDPNGISPETKTIPESMRFFAQYVIQSITTRQLEKKKLTEQLEKLTRRKSFRENMHSLNEQRKNLVALAGYTSHMVVPSFTFLFLGALMTSVVPLYEAKCIQLVATLHPSRGKLLEALLGLMLSSTLASLFTGLRGSLFWLAGMS